MKNKIIYVLIALIIIFPYYYLFHGLIVIKLISGVLAESYLEEKYELEFKIGSRVYSYDRPNNDSGYYVSAYNKDEKNIKHYASVHLFSIFDSTSYEDTYINNMIDYEISEEFRRQFQNQFQNQFEGNIKIDVSKGNYSDEISNLIHNSKTVPNHIEFIDDGDLWIDFLISEEYSTEPKQKRLLQIYNILQILKQSDYSIHVIRFQFNSSRINSNAGTKIKFRGDNYMYINKYEHVENYWEFR